MSKKELWSDMVKEIVSSEPIQIKIQHNLQHSMYRTLFTQKASSPIPTYQPDSYPMIMFTQFDQYVLNPEEGWSINALTVPTKYTAHTYGYCKAIDAWFKLGMYRAQLGMRANKGSWGWKWERIDADNVPKEHKAACVLLSQFV